MWILVLRNTKTGKSHIWQAKSFKGITRSFRLFLERKRAKDLGLWTKEAESFLWERYKTTSTSALAVPLSKLLHRKISKNAVIGHYYKMKKRGVKNDLLSRDASESLGALESKGR